MKKIMIYTMTMVLALALGTAYAGMQGARDGGHAVLFNGATDFTGKSYEIVPDIGTAALAESRVAEGSSAGGARAGEISFNGVTDFTGRSYDTVGDILSVEPVDKGGAAEGISAGGWRDEMGPHLYNGVTDFTGRSYEAMPEPL